MAKIEIELGENLLEAIKVMASHIERYNKTCKYSETTKALGREIKTAFGINFTKMVKMQSKLAQKEIPEISITS